MLALLRQIPEAQQYVKSTAWAKAPFRLTTTLAGKRIGIAGMGRIGQDLAERLKPFKVDIAYSGPNQKMAPFKYHPEINDLAKNSDILFLACPATPETNQMLNAEVLEALGPSGFLINIARGSVVDENALLYALQHNKIAGAALDVFERQAGLDQVRGIFAKYQMIAWMKTAVAHYSKDPEWLRVRPLLMQLTPEQQAKLLSELQQIHFSMPGL